MNILLICSILVKVGRQQGLQCLMQELWEILRGLPESTEHPSAVPTLRLSKSYILWPP